MITFIYLFHAILRVACGGKLTVRITKSLCDFKSQRIKESNCMPMHAIDINFYVNSNYILLLLYLLYLQHRLKIKSLLFKTDFFNNRLSISVEKMCFRSLEWLKKWWPLYGTRNFIVVFRGSYFEPPESNARSSYSSISYFYLHPVFPKDLFISNFVSRILCALYPKTVTLWLRHHWTCFCFRNCAIWAARSYIRTVCTHLIILLAIKYNKEFPDHCLPTNELSVIPCITLYPLV